MKNVFYLALILCVFSFSSCINPIGLANAGDDAFDYDEYCGDLNGGDFSVRIDGKNWSTDCVQATYTETITDTYTQKILYLYAYDGNASYFGNSDIEMAWMVWTEVTSNGETTTSQTAYFLDGFFNYAQAVNNPNYDPEEESSTYISDEYNESNIVNITSSSSTQVKGNIEFELANEETGETITMKGAFTANIEE